MDTSQESEHARPKVDQSAYNYTLSEAGTSYAGSMAGTEGYNRRTQEDDDAQTAVSTYSYRSDRDASKYLRQVDGRTVNALSDMYYLPTDSDEWNRLDKQHVAIVLGLGNLYPAAEEVRAILQPEEGQTKKILDLGCGTGVWATEMAREFPHASVVGVDLAPVPIEPDSLPPNCHFEVDDISLGLQHFEDEFDVVHIRLVAPGLKNFRKTMRDAAMCLKPGGIILWLDLDYSLYSTDAFNYLPVASELIPSGAWLQRPLYEMRRSAIKGGSDLLTMETALDEGLWDDPLMDPDTCKTGSLYLPIGPWAKSRDLMQARYLEYVGALMRQDIMSGHRAVHPLLVKSGWTQEAVKDWSDRADAELNSMKDQPSLRLRMAWGRRRTAPGVPAPPLRPVPEPVDGSFGHMAHNTFPFYFVYDTQEESLEKARERNRHLPQEMPFHPADKQQ